MKRIFSIITVLIIVLSLASCGILGNDGSEADIGSAEPVTDDTISAREATGDFTITTQDGTFLNSGNTYTVTSAGTYVLSGCLEGQVTVEAGDDDEVILELSGVTITCGKDSPIKILNADKVEISAKKDTENVINDTRSAKTAENDEQGEGAIYAKCDLKLKGNGTLVVSAAYNNGVHTTEDLTIKNLALKVTAYNNALKGNDSINIESGNIAAISTNGDGVKTSATDTNKSGVTRGDINLLGGNIPFYRDAKYWPYILTTVKMWNGVGYGSVLYMSVLAGIDTSLYEAARIDGASKWQEIRHITLPSLIPMLTVMLLLSVGGIMHSDTGLFYQVTRNTGMLYDTTQVIDSYVLNAIMKNSNFGFTAATTFFQSVVGLLLMLFANFMVNRISPENALF